jgi:hypothetical protein
MATSPRRLVRIRGGPSLSLGAPLASGTFNAVHHVQDRPELVVRQSKPTAGEDFSDLEKEAALMTLMHELGVQPRLHASSVRRTSGTEGHATSVHDKGTGLKGWLEQIGGSEDEGRRAGLSLLRKLCLVADLGFCLVDMKPDNAVMVGDDLKLIDFSPTFSVFMDPELVGAFRLESALFSSGLGPRHERGDLACAKARGMSLYLMLLMWYLFVSDPTSGAPREAGFLAVLREALRTSCVPLEVIEGLRDGALAEALRSCAYKYFFDVGNASPTPTERDRGEASALSDLVARVRREGLLDPGCVGRTSQEVRVLGVRFDRDDASCARASGRRHSVVTALDARPYPCPGQPRALKALRLVGSTVLSRRRGREERVVRVASISRSRSPTRRAPAGRLSSYTADRPLSRRPR